MSDNFPIIDNLRLSIVDGTPPQLFEPSTLKSEYFIIPFFAQMHQLRRRLSRVKPLPPISPRCECRQNRGTAKNDWLSVGFHLNQRKQAVKNTRWRIPPPVLQWGSAWQSRRGRRSLWMPRLRKMRGSPSPDLRHLHLQSDPVGGSLVLAQILDYGVVNPPLRHV